MDIIADDPPDGVTPLTPDGENNPLLAAALEMAGEGRDVIPCRPGEKRPATLHGAKDGTGDIAQIRKWWAAVPDANPALVTGDNSRVWVLDLDGPDGIAALKELEAEHGPLPRTRTAKTPRGLHKHFRTPVGEAGGNRVKIGGRPIDVRSNGGYVIIPPARTAHGVYEWVDPDAPVADAPPWLIALVTDTGRPKAPPPEYPPSRPTTA